MRDYLGDIEAAVEVAARDAPDYPKDVFKYADDDTPFDEGWLAFLEYFVSRYVPPVLEGRVEEEEIVRRADGKLLQNRVYFDFGTRVEMYIGVNNWEGSCAERGARGRAALST